MKKKVAPNNKSNTKKRISTQKSQPLALPLLVTILLDIRIRSKTKTLIKRISFSSIVIVVILTALLLSLSHSAEAAWYDTSFAYRQPIILTNNSGSTQKNLQYLLTINTSTLITNNKLQSSCQDLRFVDQFSKSLPYYIDSGCNTTTTKVWVLLNSLPTGTSQIYMYYGNMSAAAGSSSTYFDNLVGLVGYWTMNDGSGTTATDYSINANNGTLNSASWVTGQFSNALDDSAKTKTVTVTNTSVLTPSSNTWTISMWVKRSTSTAGGYLIQKGTVGTSGYDFDVGISPCTGTDTIDFAKYGVANNCLGSLPEDTNWHFIEGVASTTGVSMYIDGKLSGSNTNTSNFLSSTNNMTIGQEGTSDGFGGYIDDVHIYNTARTAAEVLTDYVSAYTIQSLVPSAPTASFGTEQQGPGPILYWKFNEGQGTTVNDSTSSNVTGTLAGTTKPAWQTGKGQCVSNNCLYFDGASSNITVTKAINNIQSIGMWINPASVSSGALIDLKGDGTKTITISSGTLSATGFTSPTYYVNGVQTQTLVANKWQYVEVTTGTAINATASLTLGKSSTTFYKGFIDEVKMFPYARSATQVKNDYNGVLLANGGSVLGTDTTNQVISNGLVGYWKMDEASWNGTAGEVKDSSGNANNGTSTNATVTTGKFGNAGSFNGTTAYIDTGNPTSLQITGALTMSAWIKLGSVTGVQEIMARHSAGGDDYDFYMNGSSLVFQANGSFWGSNSTLTTGTWYHVTAVYVPSQSVTLYINGKEDAQVTTGIPSSISNTALNFRLGAASDSTLFFNGTIDEARVYNRALSPSEVSQLYNYAPGPVGYWNFEEGTGTTANDTSGNANTGTWNGTLGKQWTSGKYGKAGFFDGSTNDVDAGNTTSEKITGPITLSAWVNVKSYPTSGNYGTIVSKGYDNSTESYTFRLNDSSGVLCGSYNGTSYGTTWGAVPALNTWYYLTCTYDGTNWKIYSNGVLVSTTAGAQGALAGTRDVMIGAEDINGSASRFLNGSIDEVRIYNYPRSAAQIIQDMNASHTTVGSSTPLAYWKFNEGYGTTAHNSGSLGSALNGTLTSSPTWTQSGKVNDGLTFPGGNYVDMGSASGLQMKNNFSFSTWVNFSSFSSYTGSGDELFFIWSTTGYFFGVNPSKQLDWGRAGVAHDILINTSMTTGVWYHIAVTVDSSDKATFYINGQQVGTGTVTEPSFSGNLHISDSTYTLLGTMDETKFYNGVLTQQDILTDYNLGNSQQYGTLGSNSTYQPQATNQLFCIPGDTTSCAGPTIDYEFEEKTGSSVNDVSGNGRTGTWNGTLGNQWSPGYLGTAGNFNGTNNYISTGVGESSALTNTAGTIEVWIYPTGASSSGTNAEDVQEIASDDQEALGISRGSLSGVAPTGGTAGQDALWVYDWALSSCTTESRVGVPYSANQWIHLAWVKSGTSTLSLYKNGVFIGSTATTTQSGCNPAANIQIGRSTIGGTAFRGKIDQVRYFNYARSAAQIAYDYNRGGPVAWWKFDECQGSTLNDSSGNGYSGTWAGGTTIGTCNTSSTAWGNGATGKFNSSLSFNGTNDYVSITNQNFGISSTAHQATVALWIKPSALSGNTVPIDNISGSQTGGFQIYVNTTGFACLPSDATGYSGTSYTSISLSTGTWYHIVCVFNGTSVTGYINGISEGTQTVSHQIINPTHTTFIGAGDSGGSPANAFSGQIDDVRIYDYPLTSTQVQVLYNQGFSTRFGPSSGTP